MHIQTLITAFIFFSIGWFVCSTAKQGENQTNPNVAQSGRYSVDLPEDFQGENLLEGTLIQLDSVCSDSCLHLSFFRGDALYGDGAQISHTIHKALNKHTIFDTEKP